MTIDYRAEQTAALAKSRSNDQLYDVGALRGVPMTAQERGAFNEWLGEPTLDEETDKGERSKSGIPYKSKKLKRVAHLRAALAHNSRELAIKVGSYNDIDLGRMSQNIVLRERGTVEETMFWVYQTIKEAGLDPQKVRKDAIYGIEVLFICLPPEGEDIKSFYEACTRWAEGIFGVPVLSSVVHMDQGQPHCHVILLPLVKGKRMQGGSLYGKPSDLRSRLGKFYEEVGYRYGFTRPPTRQPVSKRVRQWAMGRLFRFFSEKDLPEVAIKAMLKPHYVDPTGLLDALGLTLPNLDQKANAVTKYMTRSVR